MTFQFATCVRKTALGFIQAVYPGQTITDSPESAGPLLDLVEKDVVRIQDPMMHGKRIEVVPGHNWEESDDTGDETMTPHDDGGPAFPLPTMNEWDGMTLRDYFAATVLNGWIVNPKTTGTIEEGTKWSYVWADAMLKARKQPPEQQEPSEERLITARNEGYAKGYEQGRKNFQ